MASKFEKTILITGGTANLGYQCALQLANQYPKYQVIVASRSDHDHSADRINKETCNHNTIFMPLDLSNMANVRAFAAKYKSKALPPLTRLFLNAGLQFDALQYSADGFESTFAINHVGHALLFFLLRDCFDDASPVRIVITASGTHDPAQKTGMPVPVYESAELLAHPPGKAASYPGQQRYSTSKLCNMLWMYALHKRVQEANGNGKRLEVVAFDPGLMPGTGLLRDFNPIVRFVWRNILPRILPLMRLLLFPNIHTPQESGKSMAWVGMAAEVSNGRYFEGAKEIKSSEESYSIAKQDDLWTWTLDNVSQNKEERSLFERV